MINNKILRNIYKWILKSLKTIKKKCIWKVRVHKQDIEIMAH